MSLFNKTSYGFFWAIMDRGSLLLFQFLALVYLARLVTPHDFGLVAILTVFINTSNVVVDSGMIGSLIKKRDVSPIDYYTLFVYNLVLSSTIYCVLFISAPFIARFYNTPILEILIRVLSLSIVINSFGMVQVVMLTRNLNFRAQSIITFISQFLAVSISIFMAYIGYGVWALVALQLLHVFFSSILLCFVNRFKPKLEFSNRSFKEQFNFGGPLLISNLLFIVNTNIYSSAIGKFFTAIESGYFYQSYKLQNTPIGILSAVVDKVGFTVLSKEKDVKYLIDKAHNIYKYIYLITIPIFIYLNSFSEKLFLLIFDERWSKSSILFKILCFSLIPLTIKTLNRNLLKSYGKTKIILYIEIVSTIIGLSILFYTIKIDLQAIAYGVFISSLIVSLISIGFLYKILKYEILRQLQIIVKPLIISLFSVFFTNYIISYFDFSLIQEIILNPIFFLILIVLLNFKSIKASIKI